MSRIHPTQLFNSGVSDNPKNNQTDVPSDNTPEHLGSSPGTLKPMLTV